MKILIIIIFLILVFSTSILAYEPDKWTWEDTALQSIYSGILVADWAQTLHIARDIKTRHNINSGRTPYYESESERFIGKYPSKNDVNFYFTTMLIGHAAVSYLLPKPYRTIWQSVYIVYEHDIVQGNRDLGLGLSLHF